MDVQERLFSMQDAAFRDFHASLCPTLDKNTIIGVKTPVLRSIVKEIKCSGEEAGFLLSLPHSYYEENQIHAFLISQMKDYGVCLQEVDRFLPYVDNWATCDSLRPRVFSRNHDLLSREIERWLSSEEPYTVRFAIEMLMVHFLDTDFQEQYLEWVGRIQSDEYYVNMMTAWYFATALAKQFDAVLPYLEENRLDLWVHNKTIQKAVESHRIPEDQKKYLKTLRRKDG